MHRRPLDLPPIIESPDASIQRTTDFGVLDERGIDLVRAEMGVGADTTPLLEGLEDDLCQVPHWGYVLGGSVHVRYADGTEEVDQAGEAFYWPPGHTIYTEDDPADVIMFSPRDEHGAVFDHIERKLRRMEER